MQEGNQRHEPKEPGQRPLGRPASIGDAHRSELSRALSRADSAVSISGSVNEDLEVLQEDAVIQASDTGPATQIELRKVVIKTEVAGYVEHCFTCRTTEDGTVLSVSKERLIEDMTRLFMELVERKNEEARAGR